MNLEIKQRHLIEEFAKLDDWFDKYEYLIELGTHMPSIKNKYKTQENTVAGCQSQLWIASELEDGKVTFYADSDSKITKGIIAVILRVVNHQTPQDIADSNLHFLDAIGLKSNLSPSRANGLTSIIKRIKQLTTRYIEEQ